MNEGQYTEDKVLDINGAAEHMRISVRAMYQRVARRQVPYIKWGRSLRFRRSALDNLMRSLEVRHESK